MTAVVVAVSAVATVVAVATLAENQLAVALVATAQGTTQEITPAALATVVQVAMIAAAVLSRVALRRKATTMQTALVLTTVARAARMIVVLATAMLASHRAKSATSVPAMKVLHHGLILLIANLPLPALLARCLYRVTQPRRQASFPSLLVTDAMTDF
jgi:hypothetical protein